MAQTGADPIARFERPLPHPDAPFHVRVAWIKRGTSWLVRSIALDELLSPAGDYSAEVETLCRCQEVGSRITANRAEVIRAAESGFTEQTDECCRFLDALLRALWWPCRRQESEEKITALARNLAVRWDMPVSDAQLETLLRNIDKGAKPYKKRRRRGGFTR